jgi:NADP-dependent 3-hydroxy acid dehydrogenase YdfG
VTSLPCLLIYVFSPRHLIEADNQLHPTMRNLDKSTRLKEFAKKDSLPLEVLQLDVTDDKSVTDAIDMISNR